MNIGISRFATKGEEICFRCFTIVSSYNNRETSSCTLEFFTILIINITFNVFSINATIKHGIGCEYLEKGKC